MKRFKGLFWIVLLLSLGSCVSYEKYSMEVFKPAKLSIPAETHKLALISRNLKYKNDTLQNYQAKDHRLVKDKPAFNTDSLAIQTCLDSLANQMALQNRFDSIMVLPVNTFARNRVGEIRPAKTEWCRKITEKTGADALILLDMFSCFYSYSNEYSTPVANVVTSNIWSFYDAKQNKIIDRFAQIDTLYWDGNDESGHQKKLKIPAKKTAIVLASGVIGENYAKHIVPAWTIVYRDIMSCNKPELKQAAADAKKNKWETATAVWTRLAESGNKRNKYAENKSVKWIYAMRLSGEEWKIRYLSFNQDVLDIRDSRMFDETPLEKLNNCELAIFKNRLDWWDKKPRRYLDLRDKSKWPIRGLEALINSRSSSDI